MESMENESKIYRISYNINKFYATNLAFIIFISLLLLTAFIQIILFEFGVVGVNDIYKGDPNEWIFWFVTFLGISVSSCSLVGNILVQREKSSFIYWASVSISLSFINLMLAKSFFIAFTLFIAYGLLIHRYKHWKSHEQGNTKNHNTPKIVSIIIAIGFIYLLFSLAVVGIWGEQIYNKNGSNAKPEWTWWMDAISSGLIIISILLVNVKNKWGFLFQALTTLLSVTIYLEAGQYILVLYLILISILSFTTFLSWIYKDRI